MIYKTAKGVMPECLMKKKPDNDVLPIILEAAKDLERNGALAITTSCGFFAAFQKQIADSVNIPVFSSTILLLPIIAKMIKSTQKIGVITANSRGLSEAHFKGVGAEEVPVVIAGIENLPEWIKHLEEGECNLKKLTQEIADVGFNLVSENPDIGAILLECTELPSFAYEIQKQTERPVFCLYTFANFIHNVVARKKLIIQGTEI
jgi:aspartate/glutamate racemase